MNQIKHLGIALALASSALAVTQQGTRAIQLSDGTVYFAKPPRLVNAKTTDSSPYVPATYYFTVNMPETAGEPLGRITFAQQPAPEQIKFNLARSRAVAQTAPELNQELTTLVTSDSRTNTVSVRFEPPVRPGHTVKVALRSMRNPHFGGVYLFRVTAFPAGKQAHGQFLGFGRLQFDLPGGGLRAILST